MGEVKEECGIAAVCVPEKENAAQFLYKMMLQEQNRGQLSAGITTFDSSKKILLNTLREIGLVNEVFRVNNQAVFNKNPFMRYIGNATFKIMQFAKRGDIRSAIKQSLLKPDDAVFS